VRLTVCGGQSFLVVWRVQYGKLECFMAAMSKVARRKTVGLLGGRSSPKRGINGGRLCI